MEVDRATMGPERLAAKLTAYARLHSYVPAPVPGQEPPGGPEAWRRCYPLFPQLLFVLEGTGPAGVESRIGALHALTRHWAVAAFFVVHMTMCDPFQVKAIGTLRGVPSLAT